MLVVLARNIYTDSEEKADYHVKVQINDTKIWEGMVFEHWRPAGAAVLLERIAVEMRHFPNKTSPLVPGGGEEVAVSNPEVKSQKVT